MMHFNNDEEIERLLRSVCRPTAPSPQFREQLLKQLVSETVGSVVMVNQPLWKQKRLWLFAAAVIILAVIIYGIQLPTTIEPTFFP